MASKKNRARAAEGRSAAPVQEEDQRARPRTRRVRRLQGRRPAVALHERSGQDPQPAGLRQRRAAAARRRQRDQDRPGDGAAARTPGGSPASGPRPPRDGRPGRGDGDAAAEGVGTEAAIDDEAAIDETEDFDVDIEQPTATSDGGGVTMKVILRSDLDRVGKRGDIIDVADGYGRNYLLPRGLAFPATDGAVEQAAKMRRARDLRDASDREAAQTIASTLVPKVITITAKAGTEGRLFGSVTAADVAAAVAEQTGVDARPQAPRRRPDQVGRPAHGDRPPARRRRRSRSPSRSCRPA